MEKIKDFIDITPVVENQLCLSCGACDPICPTNVISFYETQGGHIFPKIDYSGCIECTLCVQVCPGVGFTEKMINELPKDPYIGNINNVFLAKSNDIKRYENSQSGGAVTEIVYQALKTGLIGAVIVAEFTENKNNEIKGKGIVVTNPEDLIKSQKSKYIPIPLLSALREVEKLDVEFGIVGVSCHIHGLSKLLEKKRKLKKKLIFKIGLICDRVMTYAGMDLLIQKSKINGEIKHFEFRDKSYKGYPGYVKVASNEKVAYLHPNERIEIKDYFTPTRCRMCFDKMNIFSDITVGDPHGISNADKKNGDSLIIIRNKQGESLLDLSISNKALKLKSVKNDFTQGQSIKYKKIEWQSFIKEYQKKNYLTPNYSKYIYDKNLKDNVKVEKQIDISTNLFTTTNRKKLINKTKKLIWIQTKKNQIKKILNFFK